MKMANSKVCIWAKWPIRPELILWRDSEYFYFPLDGTLDYRRVRTAGTYPWPELESGPLDPEPSALAMRPPRFSQESNSNIALYV